ncbi:hypothetical protein [Botrimarina mediterranea]|uniref:Uncharacterized protein n=1 Tax=Botrimarina mediterranea TaxID=2528022 RepID=A0A518K629_9BACT|nr:hypothetical protein [Botrimarina mediterranea]QDV73248.1 hypothetical protein Spa11_14440 [Botrimarina mediterranea]
MSRIEKEPPIREVSKPVDGPEPSDSKSLRVLLGYDQVGYLQLLAIIPALHVIGKLNKQFKLTEFLRRLVVEFQEATRILWRRVLDWMPFDVDVHNHELDALTLVLFGVGAVIGTASSKASCWVSHYLEGCQKLEWGRKWLGIAILLFTFFFFLTALGLPNLLDKLSTAGGLGRILGEVFIFLVILPVWVLVRYALGRIGWKGKKLARPMPKGYLMSMAIGWAYFCTLFAMFSRPTSPDIDPHRFVPLVLIAILGFGYAGTFFFAWGTYRNIMITSIGILVVDAFAQSIVPLIEYIDELLREAEAA